MVEKKIEIKYREYSRIEDLDESDRLLAEQAILAQKRSYAPYSEFNVGAAVLLENGEIVLGSNQENAAFPSGLCAERNAMFSASTQYPQVPMIGLAIAGGSQFSLCDIPATPCGACRQVMAEYQKTGGRPMKIILVGSSQILIFSKVDDVLPMIFNSLD